MDDLLADDNLPGPPDEEDDMFVDGANFNFDEDKEDEANAIKKNDSA